MMKKSLKSGLPFALSVALIPLFSGCTLPDMTDKSVDASVGGVGGAFTTSIDPTTGTPTPCAKIGELDGSIVTHKVGDGDQIHFTQDKSFWGSEVGSTVLKYNAKNHLKSVTIKVIPQGELTIQITGPDDAVSADAKN